MGRCPGCSFKPTKRKPATPPLEFGLHPAQPGIISSKQNKDVHVIFQRNLSLLVANNGELKRRLRDLVDVLDPAAVAVNGVCAESDELDAALGEFGLELGEGAEFGRADLEGEWC